MILRRLQMSAWQLVLVLGVFLLHIKGDTLETPSIGLQRLLVESSSSSSSSQTTTNSATPGSVAAATTTRTNSRSRRAQTDNVFTDTQSDNASAAFSLCYSVMDQVKTAAGTMRQAEYLEFLRMLTNSEISVDRFEDLPVVFVMIFYTAACQIGDDDCTPGNVPEIVIGNTDDPSGTIQLLCKQLLVTVTSTAVATFEYSIRYNPDTIAEDALSVCLSTATVDVLLQQLADCALLNETAAPAVARRQLMPHRSGSISNKRSWVTYNGEQNERHLQGLGSASTPPNSTCAYAIESFVERITDLRKL